MKTKLSKISKSTVSVVLAIMMLCSTVFAASSDTVVQAAKDAVSAVVETADEQAADAVEDEQADAKVAFSTAKTEKKLVQASGGDETGTYTVYFDNNVAKWSTPIYAHYWGTGQGWPSWRSETEKMDYDETKKLLYKTFPDNATNVIIVQSDGSDSKRYTSSGSLDDIDGKVVYGTNSVSSTDAETYSKNKKYYGDYTINYDNTNTNWSYVYLYSWSGSGSSEVHHNGDWPGQLMTKAEGSNIWTATANENAEHYIFNNGSGGSGNETTTFAAATETDTTYNNSGIVDTEIGDWYVICYKDANNPTAANDGTAKESFKFTPVSAGSTIYKYHTNTSISDFKDMYKPYFCFKRITSISGDTGYEYKGVTTAGNVYLGKTSDLTYDSDSKTLPLYIASTTNAKMISFRDASDVHSGYNVIMYLNLSDPNAPEFYYGFESATPINYTIYYDNTYSGWTTPHLYAFNGSTLKNGAWHSDQSAMTWNSTYNLWEETFTGLASTQIIFNDGVGYTPENSTKNCSYAHDYQSPEVSSIATNTVYCLKDDGTIESKSLAAVTAQTNYYIAGRFRKKTSTSDTSYLRNYKAYETAENGGDGINTAYYKWSDAAYENFKMTAATVDGKTVYKLDTNCTISELSETVTNKKFNSSGNSYESAGNTLDFYVLQPINTNGSSNKNMYHPSSDTIFTQYNKEEKVSVTNNASSTSYFSFDEASMGSDTGYVTLWFDPADSKFWYTLSSGNSAYTVTATTASGNTSTYLDFTSKSVIQGSRAYFNVKDIPGGMTVDTITATNTTTSETLTVNKDSNGYYFDMPGAAVNVSVTIRAKKTFTVNVTVNNATYGTVEQSATTITEGDEVSVAAKVSGGTDAYSYEFANWTFGADSSADYAAGFSATNANVTIIPTAANSSDVFTIQANFNAVSIPPYGTQVVYYGVHRQDNDNMDNYENWTEYKSLRTNDAGEYFVDFLTSDIVDSNGLHNLYFALYSNTKANSGSILNASANKTSSSTYDDVDYSSYITASQQEYSNNKYWFVQFKKADEVERFRIFFDNPNNPTTVTLKPVIVPKVEDAGTVTILAKNGTIRTGYEKYSKMATTVIDTTNSSAGITVTDSSAWSGRAQKATGSAGDILKIKTTINSSYADKYFVKAFCINGVSFNVIDEPAQGSAQITSGNDKFGVYELEYEIPAGVTNIEITPIYYYVENASYWTSRGLSFITFYAENFGDEIQEKWGNTLAVHAWYTQSSNSNNNETSTSEYNTYKNDLGGYPGQPMVYANGVRYMQIPTKNGNGDTIQGVTMNNYVWDHAHANIFWGIAGNDDTSRKNANCQTYDYDDFAALATYGSEIIVFNFKYRTTTDNSPNSSDLTNTSKFGNGWNALVDYGDRGIDLFGNRIKITDKMTGDANNSDSTYKAIDDGKATQDLKSSDEFAYLTEAFIQNIDNRCSNKLYIVSDGYVNYEEDSSYSYLGKYATKWYVYEKNDNGTFTFKGALPSSAFVPPKDGYSYEDNLENGSVNTSANKAKFLAYSSSSATARETEWSTFVYLYDNFKNRPAVITYEKAIVQSKQPGLRNDGRWYYSKEAETVLDPDLNKIVCNIEIYVKEKNSDVYVQDVFNDAANGDYTGSITKANAVFTDGDLNDGSTPVKAVTQIGSSSLNFTADAVTSYTDNGTERLFVFRGWYLVEGDAETPVNPDDLMNVNGSVPRLANNLYIAKYEEIDGKTLLVNHTSDGDGSGTTTSTVRVLNTTTGKYVFNQTSEGAITVPATCLTEDTYQITVQIAAVADDGSQYVKTVESSKIGTASATTNDPVTMTNTGTASNGVTLTSADFTKHDGGEDAEVQDIFTNSATQVKYLYTTTFDPTSISLTFKYYDRKTSGGKEDVNVEKEVKLTVNYSSKDTVEQLILNALTGNANVSSGDTVTMSNLENLMDNYYIWLTQSKAETGFGALTNYHDGSNRSYSASGADVSYHADNYGYPIVTDGTTHTRKGETVSVTDADKWVSYTPIDGYTITGKDESDPSKLTGVTVWAYNVPRTYNVRFEFPVAAEESDTTESVLTANNKLINSNATVYTLEGGNAETIGGVYSQRIGEATKREYAELIYLTDAKKTEIQNTVQTNYNGDFSQLTDDQKNALYEKAYNEYVNSVAENIDAAGTHIANYGITTGLANGNKPIEAAAKATKYKASSEAEEQTGELVFDGWYDKKTGAKITSNRIYEYRITMTTDLVAGYVLKDSQNTAIGVSVSKNAQDYYIEDDNSGNRVDKIRYNTELNVYNTDDNNTSITKTAIVYIQLPVDSTHTNEFWKTEFETTDLSDKLKADIATKLAANTNNASFIYKSSNVNGAVTITWNVREVEGTETSSTAEVSEAGYIYNNGSGGVTLNNKNRAHYAMAMNEAKTQIGGSNSAMIAYAAIYGDFGSYGYESGNRWIISDNAIAYITVPEE